MTPYERATEIAEALRSGGHLLSDSEEHVEEAAQLIAGFLQAERDACANRTIDAIATERERCAKIAEEVAEEERALADSPDVDFVDGESLAKRIAERIRESGS